MWKRFSLLSCVKENNDLVEPLGNAEEVSMVTVAVPKLLVEKITELWDVEVEEEADAVLWVSGMVDRGSALKKLILLFIGKNREFTVITKLLTDYQNPIMSFSLKCLPRIRKGENSIFALGHKKSNVGLKHGL